MATQKKSPVLAQIAEEKAKDTVKKAAEEERALGAAEKAEDTAEKATAAVEASAIATMEAIEVTEQAASSEITEADDTRKMAEEVSFAAKRVKEDALASSAAAKAAQIATIAARPKNPK